MISRGEMVSRARDIWRSDREHEEGNCQAGLQSSRSEIRKAHDADCLSLSRTVSLDGRDTKNVFRILISNSRERARLAESVKMPGGAPVSGSCIITALRIMSNA